jgi:tetratricopeptide (TPR) repeat protein
MANSVADRHVLEGRRASIEAMRGKVVVAIPLMQKVLEQNTGYYWGWQMLSTWQVDTNELEAASASLERMRQLWPTDTAVYRKLAQLARKKDDPASAKQALSRVVELLPTDIDAAHLLLELQLQDEDLTEAGRTLQAMELHLPGAATLAAGIAVSLRQSDQGRAVSLLEALCDLPDPNEWPIEYAVEAFISAGRGAAALRVLKRKSIAGTANPQSGAAAIRLFAQVNRWFTAVRFVRRLKSGEMRRRALVRVVQLLAENQRKWSFRWLYWTCREELRRDDAAWGQAGYALTRFGQQKSVSVWLDDWRTRRAVDPWMLFNYCIALRQVGKYEIADEVATHVIRHWGHRPGADDMHLFLGIERAITGRLEEATRHLQLATVRADVPYDQALKTLAESLIGFLGSAPADRRQAFAEARARVDLNCKGGIWLERGDLRRTFRRVADVLIRNGAGMRGWAWSRWKLWWPAVIMPALVLLLLALVEHDF